MNFLLNRNGSGSNFIIAAIFRKSFGKFWLPYHSQLYSKYYIWLSLKFRCCFEQGYCDFLSWLQMIWKWRMKRYTYLRYIGLISKTRNKWLQNLKFSLNLQLLSAAAINSCAAICCCCCCCCWYGLVFTLFLEFSFARGIWRVFL